MFTSKLTDKPKNVHYKSLTSAYQCEFMGREQFKMTYKGYKYLSLHLNVRLTAQKVSSHFKTP